MLKPKSHLKKVSFKHLHSTKLILRELRLNTVCEEARCPNIGECFAKKIATFMILGDTCTRNCGFCNVSNSYKGKSSFEEPQRIKEAVKILNLRYVVITSPSRDDLEDKGAEMFRAVIKELRTIPTLEGIEALIPDFSLNIRAIEMVVSSGVDVLGHNIETVPSLYPSLRKEFNYHRSLRVLKLAKEFNKELFTKSGIMLGLGERDEEIITVFKDLRAVDCDFLTIGQYFPPSLRHYPVKEYVSLERFAYLREAAKRLGFLVVRSGPYIRSSYLAHTYIHSSV